MKILWVHSFNKKANQNSGIFMFQLLENLRSKGIEIDEVYTGKISLFSIYSVVKRLKNIAKDYDIVHAQYGSGCGLVTSLLKGKKILTLRGSDWYVSKKSANFEEYIHTRLAVGMTMACVSRYNKIITMSKRMTSELKSKKNKLSVSTIMDGLDLVKFNRSNIDESLLKKYKRSNNPVVLFSSVEENNSLKRYGLAKSAYELAKNEIPNLELKFMNGIPHDEVPAFVASSDVILLTSTHEGWPNIIKEGLALNVPFVATNVSDLKEIANKEFLCTVVEEMGKDTMIIKLAAGIVHAINNNRKDTDDLTVNTKEMSMDFISEKIINIYHTI